MEYITDGHMASATRQADGAYFSYFGEFELEGDEVRHHGEMAAGPKLGHYPTKWNHLVG